MLDDSLTRRDFVRVSAATGILGFIRTGACGGDMPNTDVTLGAWKTHRDSLLRVLGDRLEGMPDRGPLESEEFDRREFHKHTEIRVHYDGEPGERIPAYLLIPRRAGKGRLPAVLAAHQCSWKCDIGKEQVVGKCVHLSDQAYGLELVHQGFVVLAPDANKVGERYDPDLRKPWQTPSAFGNSQDACCTAPGGSWGSIRWKPVFDAMRGIDFLSQHERVDPDRIGMIGHSLGADTTLWTMPVEERIRAAAISGGGLIHSSSSYGIPYADVLSLIAPRPYLEVTGYHDYTNNKSKDPDLSIDERMGKKRNAHMTAKAVYRLLGHEDKLERYEFDGGHSFPAEGRQAAYAWFKRWL